MEKRGRYTRLVSLSIFIGLLLASAVSAETNSFCAFAGRVKFANNSLAGPGIIVNLTFSSDSFSKTGLTDLESRYGIPVSVLADGRNCTDNEIFTLSAQSSG